MTRLPLIVSLLTIAISFTSGCGTSQQRVTTSQESYTRTLARQPFTPTNQSLAGSTGQRVGPYRLPYSTTYVMSDYWECRGSRRHRGLDLGGIGPDAGLGTPVVSMGRARIVIIGTPEMNATQFGQRLRHRSTTQRGHQRLPVWRDIPPYGRVWFFTENYGSWRSGVIIVTQLLDGPLAGYRVRYMHLAAVHPSLREGDVVEAGQEIGLLGGTAILESSPHLHIDAENPGGQRIDLAPYFGLRPRDPADRPDC